MKHNSNTQSPTSLDQSPNAITILLQLTKNNNITTTRLDSPLRSTSPRHTSTPLRQKRRGRRGLSKGSQGHAKAVASKAQGVSQLSDSGALRVFARPLSDFGERWVEVFCPEKSPEVAPGEVKSSSSGIKAIHSRGEMDVLYFLFPFFL